jgi:hypothetical protein
MKNINLLLMLIFSLFTKIALAQDIVMLPGQCTSGNCHDGYGVFLYNNGLKYDGYWKDGCWDGQGTLIYGSGKWEGDKYVGHYERCNRQGYGVYYYSNGNRYEGQWGNNKTNGYGVYYFADGGRYEGQWLDDKRNGNGTRYYANGDKFVGVYENDERVSGITYYANGDQYEGKVNDNLKRQGQGTLTTKNGEKQEGEWENDILFNGWITKLNGDKIKIENGKVAPINQNDVTTSLVYLKSPVDLHDYAAQYFLTNTTNVAKNVHWSFKVYSNVKSSTGSFEGDQYIIGNGQVEIVTFTQVDQNQPWHVDPPTLTW